MSSQREPHPDPGLDLLYRTTDRLVDRIQRGQKLAEHEWEELREARKQILRIHAQYYPNVDPVPIGRTAT